MKTLLPVLIILSALPSLANAQQMRILCEDCRDLTRYPEDARNFGYNQVFGSHGWLTVDMADRFQIVDPFGTAVTIDINVEYLPSDLHRWLDVVGMPVGEVDAIGRLLMDDVLIQVRVIYQNLDIVTYEFTGEDVSGELPVGETNTRHYSSVTGGGDSDEFNDAADYEYDDDPGPDDYVCEACTMQVIYDDGSLGDPVDLWTEEEWEEIQEL